jgi:hypothetical protein
MQDVYEVDAGLAEATSLADGLEPAVQLERAGAVPVAEQPAVRGGLLGNFVVIGGDGVGFDGTDVALDDRSSVARLSG